MNYKLSTNQQQWEKAAGLSSSARARAGVLPQSKDEAGFWVTLKKIARLVGDQQRRLTLSAVAILVSSAINLVAPLIGAHVIDKYIAARQYSGVLYFSGILLGMFVVSTITSYIQTRLMGGVGQRTLFRLRNELFNKLQELPVAFFNQNKAGDLISRINNDTDNLNQFFSQSLIQFVGSIVMMLGAGIFVLSIHPRLGVAALAPAVLLLVFTQAISGWVKRKNLFSLQALGNMSAEIQESLENFKVVIAFNRRDYFRNRFEEVNRTNYQTSVTAGIANNLFNPVYGLAANLGQLIVLAYGIYLVSIGQFTIGLLISYIVYINNFYNPLRQLASLWSNFQQALASWDRVSEILNLSSDLAVVPAAAGQSPALLEFKDVSFGYPEGREVLHKINFQLLAGKTYAFVGPTGGGKSTTASLMARLYDPTRGDVYFGGRDLKSFSLEDRTSQIGFILQEPFLFTGTVGENIRYGNPRLAQVTSEDLLRVLQQEQLEGLLARFEQGLDTPVQAAGSTISLGQKQLIAFIRAALRKPKLLILDEATANVDTVTEQLLQEILDKLPKETTRVIIAHRLNTIENADEIFFVNAGEIVPAGSMEHAVSMLLDGKRES